MDLIPGSRSTFENRDPGFVMKFHLFDVKVVFSKTRLITLQNEALNIISPEKVFSR